LQTEGNRKAEVEGETLLSEAACPWDGSRKGQFTPHSN